MMRWRKLGLTFSPQKDSTSHWMAEFAQAPHVQTFEDRFRVYFATRSLPDSDGQYLSRIGWVELDRQDPTQVLRVAGQPVLDLGQRGCFDEFGTYPASMVSVGEDLWMFYGGWTRRTTVPFDVAIGVAISHDGGDSFQRVGPGPVLGFSPEEPFVVSGPKVRRFSNIWYLFYIAGRRWIEHGGRLDPVYKIRLATSFDGIHWTRHNQDLIPDRLGADEAQASPDVYFDGQLFHMFFCYREGIDFRSPGRGYRIGYASSPDLYNWHRKDSAAGLGLSRDGWDSESMSYPHLFSADDKIYMAYLGNNVGRFGFGLAVLEGGLR